jgi:hypothetical protein
MGAKKHLTEVGDSCSFCNDRNNGIDGCYGKQGTAGYTPHVFAESEKVPWNQRVTKIQFLGVRKPLQAKGLQTIVDRTMAEIRGPRQPFTHSSATVAPYPNEKR